MYIQYNESQRSRVLVRFFVRNANIFIVVGRRQDLLPHAWQYWRLIHKEQLDVAGMATNPTASLNKDIKGLAQGKFTNMALCCAGKPLSVSLYNNFIAKHTCTNGSIFMSINTWFSLWYYHYQHYHPGLTCPYTVYLHYTKLPWNSYTKLINPSA